MKILPIFAIIAVILSSSCSHKQTKKYAVVCSFGSVVYETEDKDEAFKKANELTSFGRVFASKPTYFVMEK